MNILVFYGNKSVEIVLFDDLMDKGGMGTLRRGTIICTDEGRWYVRTGKCRRCVWTGKKTSSTIKRIIRPLKLSDVPASMQAAALLMMLITT